MIEAAALVVDSFQPVSSRTRTSARSSSARTRRASRRSSATRAIVARPSPSQRRVCCATTLAVSSRLAPHVSTTGGTLARPSNARARAAIGADSPLVSQFGPRGTEHRRGRECHRNVGHQMQNLRPGRGALDKGALPWLDGGCLRSRDGIAQVDQRPLQRRRTCGERRNHPRSTVACLPARAPQAQDQLCRRLEDTARTPAEVARQARLQALFERLGLVNRRQRQLVTDAGDIARQ